MVKYIGKIVIDENTYHIKDIEARTNLIDKSEKGAASGVATLDANGKVPSSLLPSYVDDVLEYESSAEFPVTGESSKIYVDLLTNKTYRWGGSDYVEISKSLALGDTSSTAYRGDRGKTAYTHATDSSRLTTATSVGLYKVGCTAQGHISGLTAITKADITGLGIPAQDTNTTYSFAGGTNKFTVTPSGGTAQDVTVTPSISAATQSAAGLMSAADKEKLDGIATGAEVNVQSDWNATSGDAFIKNKPTIPDSFQWYGTSSTEAATVQKEVSIPSITSLKTGQIIVVHPTVTSTVADSTLKLNSFDAYPMRYNNAAITTSTDSVVWNANFPSLFVFDGSYWVFLGHGLDSNTTYSAGTAALLTAGTDTSNRVWQAKIIADYVKSGVAVASRLSYGIASDGGKGATNPYHLVGEITIDTSSARNTTAVFLVDSHYQENRGILVVQGRVDANSSTINTQQTYAKWLVKPASVDVNNFILTTKTTSDSLTCRLYYKIRYTWDHARFVRIDEGSWSGSTTNWELFSTNSDTAGNYIMNTIPADETQFVSTVYSYAFTGATSEAAGIEGTVPAPAAGKQVSFLRGDGTWVVPTDTTYTFAGGTNKITVTPAGGTAQNVTVTPSITNNVTGSAAWTAADVITTTNASSGNVIKASGKTITTTAPSSSSADTTVPTSKAVYTAITNGMATADAMVYKGTVAGGSTGSYGALTPAASKGETYKVTTAGKIDGIAVEVGDMIICNTDSTAAATSSNYSTIAANWDFIQANIDGAVTGPAGSTDAHIAVFNGTSGKTIKDSGYTIGKSVPSDAKFTDTTYTFDGTYNASTNKAATVSTVTNAINALDGGTIGTGGAGKTITALSQTNGNVFATFGDISITKSQVSDFPTIPTVNNAKFSIKGAGTEVASTTANASSASSVDIVAGSNVTVTPDATNKKITIAATDTTYSAATTSAAGLMSADDKTKLNGIATGATKVTTDTVSGWGYTKNVGTVTGVKMNGTTKSPSSGVVDLGTVLTSHQDISGKVNTTTTVNGHALSSNVTVTKSDVGLGNVGNFKAVSTVASQGLSDTEKANARVNIGAGTSSFSGSYNDLSDKPTIPAAAANGTYTVKTLVGSTTTNVSDFTANQSSADDVTFVQGSNVTITPDTTNRKITIAAKDTTYGVVSTSANGLAPKVTDTSKFLKGDGTWATPTDTNNRRSFYGTCDTAAATAAKVVTISDTSGWELKAGTIVGIKFTNTNSASNVTLNVNSSGAKSIWYNNAEYTGKTNSICGYADRVTYYMYDGTYWVWLNMGSLDGNTDTKVTQTATTTSADYEVLFSATADNTTRTETARKSSNLKFNPSTGNLQATQLNGVTIGSSPKFTDNDTKNTTGTTNKTGTKMFLAAATAQSANPVTYSNSNCYIGTDNCLYSGGAKVLTSHQDISGKADKTATVSDVSYDQSTGKLKKTVNGTTTNVCDVVTSGFRIIADDTTGYDTLTAFGSASITPNDSTGYDAFVY